MLNLGVQDRGGRNRVSCKICSLNEVGAAAPNNVAPVASAHTSSTLSVNINLSRRLISFFPASQCLFRAARERRVAVGPTRSVPTLIVSCEHTFLGMSRWIWRSGVFTDNLTERAVP